MFKKVGLLASAALGLTALAVPAATAAEADVPLGPSELAEVVGALPHGGDALGHGTAALLGGLYTDLEPAPPQIDVESVEEGQPCEGRCAGPLSINKR